MSHDFYDPLKQWERYYENRFPPRVASIVTDAAPPDGIRHMIFLAGAIKFWWLSRCTNCNIVGERKDYEGTVCTGGVGPVFEHVWYEFWGSDDHKRYIEHRDNTRHVLIEEGFLTYAPHEAFKGRWVESAQKVNDAAIRVCSAMVVMSPKEACGARVITDGTDDEICYAQSHGKPVIWYSPTDNVSHLLQRVEHLLSRPGL